MKNGHEFMTMAVHQLTQIDEYLAKAVSLNGHLLRLRWLSLINKRETSLLYALNKRTEKRSIQFYIFLLLSSICWLSLGYMYPAVCVQIKTLKFEYYQVIFKNRFDCYSLF